MSETVDPPEPTSSEMPDLRPQFLRRTTEDYGKGFDSEEESSEEEFSPPRSPHSRSVRCSLSVSVQEAKEIQLALRGKGGNFSTPHKHRM